MAEFGGEPEVQLVPGSLRGARAFKLNGHGILTGVFQEQEWTEGENTAYHIGGGATHSFLGQRAGVANCTCGFYAYFHATTVHHASASTVLGIVEGYGRTTFGYFGFRSSKAKILAIYNPYLPTKTVQVGLVKSRFPRLHRAWLKTRNIWLGFRFPIAALLVYFICLGLTEWLVSQEPWHTMLVTIRLVAWFLWLLAVVVQTGHGIRHYRKRKKRAPNPHPHQQLSVLLKYAQLNMRSGHQRVGRLDDELDPGGWAEILETVNNISAGIPPSRFDALREQYPEIPVYGDMEQMFRDFPPTSRAELNNIGETT